MPGPTTDRHNGLQVSQLSDVLYRHGRNRAAKQEILKLLQKDPVFDKSERYGIVAPASTGCPRGVHVRPGWMYNLAKAAGSPSPQPTDSSSHDENVLQEASRSCVGYSRLPKSRSGR